MEIKKGKWYTIRELPYYLAKFVLAETLGSDKTEAVIRAYENWFFTTEKGKTSTEDFIDFVEKNLNISLNNIKLII